MFEKIIAQIDTSGLTDACGSEPSFVCEWIWDVTANERLAEISAWGVEKPLKILFILVGAYIANRVLKKAISTVVGRLVQEKSLTEDEEKSDALVARVGRRAKARLQKNQERAERSRQRAKTLGGLLSTLSTLTTYSLGVLLALGEIGFDLGPLIAGAGIVGFAVGFGAQSAVSDFIAGIFILVEDQYAEGDFVDLGEASGTVERVSLRTTVLRDVNGAVWVVPNGEIRRVCNSSQIWARSVLDVDVAYDTDIDLAASVIKEVADQLWKENLESATIIEEPEIWGVQNFGADSISIRLAVKTEAGEQWSTARKIRARLKKAFDENGIEIPFPQRTIWVREVENQVVAERPKSEIRKDLLDGRSGSDGDE
ncbi:MAG: mechanosensitive ion channel protein MscS [Actinobacteria bacterium]|nr:mechanosensitive ion channel protein MscS [Actinomycetota bacterium]|tara:strand:+ start:2718 stop:3824 length:1107 start_codon:yes stop_codon:yes gene_type:complete